MDPPCPSRLFSCWLTVSRHQLVRICLHRVPPCWQITSNRHWIWWCFWSFGRSWSIRWPRCKRRAAAGRWWQSWCHKRYDVVHCRRIFSPIFGQSRLLNAYPIRWIADALRSSPAYLSWFRGALRSDHRSIPPLGSTHFCWEESSRPDPSASPRHLCNTHDHGPLRLDQFFGCADPLSSQRWPACTLSRLHLHTSFGWVYDPPVTQSIATPEPPFRWPQPWIVLRSSHGRVATLRKRRSCPEWAWQPCPQNFYRFSPAWPVTLARTLLPPLTAAWAGTSEDCPHRTTWRPPTLLTASPIFPPCATHWKYSIRRLDCTTAGRSFALLSACATPARTGTRSRAGSGPARVRRRLLRTRFGDSIHPCEPCSDKSSPSDITAGRILE